jgi:hypothetical protein
MLQGMPSNDLLKESKQLIARIIVWEICDRSVPRPRDDRSDKDANEKGAFDAVKHQ